MRVGLVGKGRATEPRSDTNSRADQIASERVAEGSRQAYPRGMASEPIHALLETLHTEVGEVRRELGSIRHHLAVLEHHQSVGAVRMSGALSTLEGIRRNLRALRRRLDPSDRPGDR